MIAKLPFQIINSGSQVYIGGIRAENPYGMHGIQPQAARKGVGRVAVLFHDLQNLLPGSGAYLVAAV